MYHTKEGRRTFIVREQVVTAGAFSLDFSRSDQGDRMYLELIGKTEAFKLMWDGSGELLKIMPIPVPSGEPVQHNPVASPELNAKAQADDAAKVLHNEGVVAANVIEPPAPPVDLLDENFISHDEVSRAVVDIPVASTGPTPTPAVVMPAPTPSSIAKVDEAASKV